MKSLIIVLLCSSLLFEACTTSSLITEKEQAQLRADPEDAIGITLNDGSKVEAEPYHYVEVNEPSDFVFGIGQRLDKNSGKYSEFKGKINSVSVDSSDTSFIESGGGRVHVRYYNFLLSDSSKVRFKKDDYFTVYSKENSGIWCTGLIESKGQTRQFKGRIPYDSIRTIEVQKFSTVQTVVLLAGVAGAAYLIAYGIAAKSAAEAAAAGLFGGR